MRVNNNNNNITFLNTQCVSVTVLCALYFFYNCIYLFIFGCSGSSLLQRLSLVAASRGYSLAASHCGGFFCCGRCNRASRAHWLQKSRVLGSRAQAQ